LYELIEEKAGEAPRRFAKKARIRSDTGNPFTIGMRTSDDSIGALTG
jgi:hypothetical protein